MDQNYESMQIHNLGQKNGLSSTLNLVLLQLKPFALETFLPFTFFLNLH